MAICNGAADGNGRCLCFDFSAIHAKRITSLK